MRAVKSATLSIADRYFDAQNDAVTAFAEYGQETANGSEMLSQQNPQRFHWGGALLAVDTIDDGDSQWDKRCCKLHPFLQG
jgi:hypothetical protein